MSDIDTTSEIKVNNLILPINIAPITLSDIITINQGDQIQEVKLNGQTVYAVRESGEINSSEIVIEPFTSEAPTINPTVVEVHPEASQMPAGMVVKVPFDKVAQRLIYKAENLDDAIISISDLFLQNGKFEVIFSAEEPENVEMSLENLKFTLPKGMSLTSKSPSDLTYDAETGECIVPQLDLHENEAKVVIEIKSINLPANDSFVENHNLNLDTRLDIEGADVVMRATANAQLPNPITIDIKYELSDMVITAVSGEVEYNIEGIDIAPVYLSSLPDFFKGDETNVILANPQINLSLTNPLGNYGLDYKVGLSLTSVKGDEEKTYSPNDGTFTVGHSQDLDKRFAFCLSPKQTSYPVEGFEDAQYVPFTSLGMVLSGNGLPDEIKIDLPGTQIFRQTVDHFELGTINGVKGDW
ncbi:MAG: hypothetical protein K2H15_08275 [Muribaculaceae bacterium]|nr:hypothetical protein [Muribaculaceae bacterium]